MKPAYLALALAIFGVVIVGKAAEPAPPITLEGVLEVGEFYGPSGYGENPGGDRIEHSLFLQLPATPTTQLSDSKALTSFGPDAGRTYFVQLIVQDPERFETEKAIGRRVRIIGVPFAPLTGHHRTPLLIDVRSLKPIDAWSW
ncbi:DUF4431 domain-containing protein [Paraburkholderia sp. PGU19]|uniref:DUF4431 domain-containing protein n=1 Tax=Paraburkholderia sp. PGU19 TaxID=2735434 RepID=UPI0015DBBB3C|nr:DUF4431 domain-containing protein [Paraburkholderia sp. PGU19]